MYTSQPPGFYWVLRVLAAPFGSSVEGIRLGFAALALAGVGAAIVLGWRLYGPPAGVAAGALIAIGPPYPSRRTDGGRRCPRGRARPRLACVAGLWPARPSTPVLERRGRRGARARGDDEAARGSRSWSPSWRSRWRHAWVAVCSPRPPPERESCSQRSRLPMPARSTRSGAPSSAITRARPSSGATARTHAGSATCSSRERPSPGSSRPASSRSSSHAAPGARGRCGRFVPAAMLFLVLVRPLADHHLLLLTVAYAVSAGRASRSGSRSFGRAGCASEPRLSWRCSSSQGSTRSNGGCIATTSPSRAEIAVGGRGSEAGHRARRTVVVSDQPIVPFLARREQPGPLVDTSNTRVTGGGLTAAEVIAEIERAQPSAVVVGRMLRTLPAVLAHARGALSAAGPLRRGDALPAAPRSDPPPPCPSERRRGDRPYDVSPPACSSSSTRRRRMASSCASSVLSSSSFESTVE